MLGLKDHKVLKDRLVLLVVPQVPKDPKEHKEHKGLKVQIREHRGLRESLEI